MSKVPEIKPFKPTTTNKTIICWKPGTTEADKQEDMKEIEKFMAFRIARAKKNSTKAMGNGL